jgi:hydroxymethylbilane synthase
MGKRLVVGTRGSKLALWQANFVADQIMLHVAGVDVEIKRIATTGDKVLDVPLAKIGGKGLFTKEIEKELLTGEIDVAVHSLKDMPTEQPDGLIFGAVTARTDCRDALISPIYKTLANLPQGAKVGTSSLRRKAQLLNRRPDLKVMDLRGNLDTRLAKLDKELDAIVLAVAGLKRLGWENRITQVLPFEICLPAAGQGALVIEIRDGDEAMLKAVSGLNNPDTHQAVAAERSFLNELEGGCQVPIGAYGKVEGDSLVLEAVILSPDGRLMLRDKIIGQPQQAQTLGRTLARNMYAAGGKDILQQLTELTGNGEDNK